MNILYIYICTLACLSCGRNRLGNAEKYIDANNPQNDLKVCEYSYHGSYNFLESLLQAGVDANTRYLWGDRYLTPLHLAVVNQKIESIKILIKYGGKFNEIDDLGRTPLKYAINLIHFNPDIIITLFESQKFYFKPNIFNYIDKNLDLEENKIKIWGVLVPYILNVNPGFDNSKKYDLIIQNLKNKYSCILPICLIRNIFDFLIDNTLQPIKIPLRLVICPNLKSKLSDVETSKLLNYSKKRKRYLKLLQTKD